jgi:hypothetical protein
VPREMIATGIRLRHRIEMWDAGMAAYPHSVRERSAFVWAAERQLAGDPVRVFVEHTPEGRAAAAGDQWAQEYRAAEERTNQLVHHISDTAAMMMRLGGAA